MKRSITFEVVTPHAGMTHHMPAGFVYANEMLAEGKLAGRFGQELKTDAEMLWLRRCLYYLDRRFQQRLRVHLIEPMSIQGLLRVVRYRIRTYPTFLIGGESYAGRDLAELEAFIRRQIGLTLEE